MPTAYHDIAVLACPGNGTAAVSTAQMLNLTAHMDAHGQLDYTFPAGEWTVYRIGYTSTMANPHPLPDELIDRSLEADKMTARHTRFHWEHVITPLVQHLKGYVGRSLKHMLIDSYEAGEQNWSEDFRQEFIRRKGYDPVPWLITTQQTVNDNEQTGRFAWDYRDVIADLYYTNGWKTASDMLHRRGMTLFQEPYYGPFSIADGAALADVPMGEFWTGSNGAIQPEVPAAARAAGRTIVGAEAFTGSPALSAWTEDPAMLKPGDNELEIAVTNNWANALIGDEQIPADFEWGEDRGTNGRMLKKYPDWFLKGQPRPSARKCFTIWYYHRAGSPLQKAGLIGPVRLEESIVHP